MQSLKLKLLFLLLAGYGHLSPHPIKPTTVKTYCGKEIATAKGLERTLNEIIAQSKTPKKSAKSNHLNLLVLFDFDGVIFPLGGSKRKNLDFKMVKIIQLLKRQGVIVGGLTHRKSTKYVNRDLPTFMQEFTGFNLLPKEQVSFGKDSLFKEGVFFVGKRFNKGMAFTAIIKKLREKHQLDENTNVVFVDDSPGNLISVENSCKNLGLGTLFNLHYVASWKAAARVQVGHYGTIPMLLLRKLMHFLPHRMHPELV